MPPPTAPVSKPTDPNELADALTSAGIDLKAEEAQLAQFATASTTSSAAAQYPGQQISEQEIRDKALRRQAEFRTQHFNDPFLAPQILSNRLCRKTRAESCSLYTLRDNDGNIAGAGPNADIAVLLSLATRERIIGLVTRGAALAKARRRPQTLVQGEWADRVKGVTPELAPISAVSPGDTSLKRKADSAFAASDFASTLLNKVAAGSFSTANNLPAPTANTQTPGQVATANLSNEIVIALRQLKQKEFDREQERLRKKAKRDQPAESSVPSTPGATGDPTTPGIPLGEAQPDRKMSAKENRKQQASKLEEAMSHRAANATASMMMGGFGGGKKKKKTYSWMNPAPTGGGMGMGGAARPAMGGPQANAGIAQGGPADTGVNLNWTGQRMGLWREDGDRGRGIQIRDWVGALEGDGRTSKKSIVKAYLKMK